jgi:4-amino-4-deoxy-L-arabinose transferase-like glycosyltransferase
MPRLIRHNLSIVILFIIIIYAILLRVDSFNSIWLQNISGHDGAFYSMIARNYLRYGWLNIKFAQFLDAGPLQPDSVPYTRHPPLFPILVSISFKLFGIHEWAARLVPLIFSVGTIIAFYLLVSKVWNQRIALLSCFIMSLMPMASYYGVELSSEGNMILFSFILTTYFYILYLENRRVLYLILIISSFLLGALTDWPAFYSPLLLSLHYILFSKQPMKHKSFFAFPIFASFVFICLFFIYPKILTGSYSAIMSKFLYRIGSSSSDREIGQTFTIMQWFKKLFSYYLKLYTVPILILSLIWFANFIKKLVNGETLSKDIVVIIFLLFGLIHIFLGRQGAWIHPYWSAPLIPGLAIASALPLEAIYNLVSRPSIKYGLIAKSGFFLSLLGLIVYCTLRVHSLHQVPGNIPYDYEYQFGTTINKFSDFSDGILISDDILPSGPLQFYADRYMSGRVTNLNQFYGFYNNNFQRYRYFFLPKDHQIVYRALYEFLDKSFYSKKIDGFLIFDLKRKKIDDNDIIKYLENGQCNYDFLDHLEDGEIAEEKDGNVREGYFYVDQKPRDVLYMHPNSKITFKNIFIHKNSSLNFGIGINQIAWDKKGDGVSFKVMVASQGRHNLIFSKYINPKARLDDRRWHDFTIDLEPFSNQEVSITFRTQSGPRNNIYFDWAGWSYPQIISRPDHDQG